MRDVDGEAAGEAAGWTAETAMAALARAGAAPVIVAVEDDAARPVSGAELRRLTLGMAAALDAAGAARGATVALWAPNSSRWVAAGLACHRAGAILAPLDALTAAGEAAAAAAAAGATLALVERDAEAFAAAGVSALDLATVAPRDDGPAAAPLGPGDAIALFRTSGTTGAPKAFTLTLGNIGWNVAAIAGSGLLRPGDRVLSPLPFHHVFPWITGALSCLTVGAPMVLPEGLSGPQVAAALRLGRPTVAVGVPRLYEALLAGVRNRLAARGRLAAAAFDGAIALSDRLTRATGGRVGPGLLAPLRRMIAPDLRMLVSGGARLSPETEAALEAMGWDVRSGYGLAETAASAVAPLSAKRRGSVGRPLPGVSARIDAPGPDGTGEILLKGPMVFSGYRDNPGENAAAFTSDGFFRTGDLGRIDADGFLFVTGRSKELIKLAGGDKLYPEDVEKAYLAAPQVGEIGVMEKDGALVALIVPDMAEVAKLSAAQPENAVRVGLGGVAKGLPSTWRLAGFALTREPLPRTRLGKLRRFALPALYDRAKGDGAPLAPRALAEEDRAWIAEPPRAPVWALLAREAGARPLDLDTHLQLDLGLDSFGWMTLAVAIEEATGVRLDAADIAGVATARDLLTRVSEKPADGRADAVERAAFDADRARWLAPRTPAERALGAALFALDALAMRLVWRLEVEGAERLPAEGPLLICPNHASYLDALALAAAMPAAVRDRSTWAGAETQMFHTAVHRLAARATGTFPVRAAAPTRAVDLAAEALARGAAQVWFPEGWLSPDGRLMPFLAGVGHLLRRTGAPVVPVRIAGTFEAWPRDRRLPRAGRVRVTFGAPVPADALLPREGEDSARAQAAADALRAQVEALGAALS